MSNQRSVVAINQAGAFDVLTLSCGHFLVIGHDDANFELSLVGAETNCEECK